MDTEWYVITGAPSSGKTTLLERIASLGYQTVPEAARVFIDTERARGRTLREIRADEALFQQIVLGLKVKIERRTPTDQLTFFDRGIPDSTAYYQICKQDPAPVLQASRKRRYKGVFLLSRLPFENDYSRVEDEATAEMLDELLYRSYTDLGYKVVRVPVMPIDERAHFILGLLT